MNEQNGNRLPKENPGQSSSPAPVVTVERTASKKTRHKMFTGTLSRREFIAVSATAGAAILLTGTLPVAAQEKKMKKTFTILHTNDMHSSLIGMGPSADYTPFTLNDDTTRGEVLSETSRVRIGDEQSWEGTEILKRMRKEI